MIDVGKTQATVSGATPGLLLLEETVLSKQSAESACGHCSSCFVLLPWLPSTTDYRLLRYNDSFHPQVHFFKKFFACVLTRQYDIAFLPLFIHFLSIFVCMLCLYVCLHVCSVCVYEHVESLNQIHECGIEIGGMYLTVLFAFVLWSFILYSFFLIIIVSDIAKFLLRCGCNNPKF